MSLKDEFKKMITELTTKFPNLPITMDATKLSICNKILCTSTTILNNSLDEVLAHCSPDAFVSIIGPTAGYFPDPLFARGVDVVGGRVVKNGDQFLQLLKERKRWGDATQRTCFQKETYALGAWRIAQSAAVFVSPSVTD